MNDTAIVIVTYNSAAEIGECLDALRATEAEIVVVDNASSDGTRVEVTRRGIGLIANAENRGFAAAVNQGFRATSAEFVLLLNPDAVLRTSLAPLREQLLVPGAGAAGGQLSGADGRPQAGFMLRRLPTPAALCFECLGINRLWPRNPVNWSFRCFDVSPVATNPIAAEQPAGAFLLVRREAWQQLGGFDERFYPLWFEDVDFCLRLKVAGWNVFYVPGAVAKHAGAHSIRSIRVENRQIYWYGSLLGYAAKHYTPFGRRLVCFSVIVGSAVRSFAGIFRPHGWPMLRAGGGIIRLAGRYLFTDDLVADDLVADEK